MLNTLFPYFSNDVSKIPVVNQIITANKDKAIYDLFCSGIYHKPHSIFKSKSYEFHNRNVGLFSGNDTRMAGYFVGMHKHLRMKKALIATFSSAEFNTMALNSKLSEVVSYIQDKKGWERIYVLMKIIFLFFAPFILQTATKQECKRYSIIP